MELWYLLEFIFVFCFLKQINGHIHSPLFRIVPPNDMIPQNLNMGKKTSIDNNTKILEVIDTNLSGLKNFGYFITVSFGTPPQNVNLIIDTGSSNTAVSGPNIVPNTPFFNPVLSRTFSDLNVAVSVKYDSGSWNGKLATDQLTLNGIFYKDAPNNIQHTKAANFTTKFTLITESKGFFNPLANWNGILGLAYSVLAQPMSLLPKSTVFDDLVSAYRLKNIFSIALCGYTNKHISTTVSGHFIAGGINESLYDGPIVYIAIHRRWFYDIIISRISVDNKPIILSKCEEYNRFKTIIDTGTSLTLFSRVVYHSLIGLLKHNIKPNTFLTMSSPFWDGLAMICVRDHAVTNISLASYFPDIEFDLVINDTAAVKLALSPQNYLTLALTRTDIYGNKQHCFKLGFGKSATGTVLGDTFMEGFYFVFDRQSNRVGIAKSKCNSYLSNVLPSRIVKIMTQLQGLESCASKSSPNVSLFDYVTGSLSIVLCIIFGGILLPTVIILLYFQCRTIKNINSTNNRGSISQSSIFSRQTGYQSVGETN